MMRSHSLVPSRSPSRLGRAGLFAAVLCLASAGSARAGGLACGDTVGPGGTVKLDADLSGCTGVGLNVVGPVTLDLAGHTVSCNLVFDTAAGVPRGADTIGLLVTGLGARVKNGAVGNCHFGVQLAGEGKHSVSQLHVRDTGVVSINILSSANKVSTNVVVDDNISTSDSIVVEVGADKNTVRGNLIIGGSGDGVDVRSIGNKISGNMTVSAGDSGLDENDDGAAKNKFSKNITYASSYSGIELTGTAAKVTGNFVVGPSSYGIDAEIATNGAKIQKNVVLGSATGDLDDANAACGSGNSWSKNVFLTSNDACIH